MQVESWLKGECSSFPCHYATHTALSTFLRSALPCAQPCPALHPVLSACSFLCPPAPVAGP